MRWRYLIFIILAPFYRCATADPVSVSDFLRECKHEKEPCIAFVMGVVEGARHQTREWLNEQPYAYKMHGQPVCLPLSWGSLELTDAVLAVLEGAPKSHQYSAVSGVLYALATHSTCRQT